MGESLAPDGGIDLFELSTILDRVAERVRTAANNPALSHGGMTSIKSGAAREQLVAAAETIYSERRRRERAFDGFRDLLSDHVLDMLLALFIGHERSSAVSLSSACYAAGAPQSTGLRYVARLEERGLISRYNDPLDKRRQLLDLTDSGLALMENYLAAYPSGALAIAPSGQPTL